jgi:hypothetical protein
MLVTAPDINEVLRPDVIILDEAQRIKNWQIKTARQVKSLRSLYARSPNTKCSMPSR